MDSKTSSEMFKAQAHIYKHAFTYANSMVLGCAIQLGIPDIIHNHKKPVTLSELVSKLNLPQEKSNGIHRLMRLLIFSGFFGTEKIDDDQDSEGYVLTLSSKLLLKSEVPNLSPFVRALVDPVMVNPWQKLGDWFLGNETSTPFDLSRGLSETVSLSRDKGKVRVHSTIPRPQTTPFETAHGVPMWEFCDQDPRFNRVFNEGMASDSEMMCLVVKDCGQVFQELNTLVDVGGGTGIIAKTILEAFPHIKCTVLDLPHVVANLPETENFKYVGGDMFQPIPSADAFLFKHVMHNWSDEDCVKMLKRCKEAIIRDKDGGRKGKVLIIDIVLNDEDQEPEMTEVKLVFDVLMMVLLTGRERTEKEWEKLFLEAGFMSYKITPIFGLRSLIEVFP